MLEVFPTENWRNLNDRKTLHKIFDCQAFLKSFKWKDALAVFPTKNPNKKMKAKQNYFKRSYEGDIQQIKLNLGQSTTLPLQNRRKII